MTRILRQRVRHGGGERKHRLVQQLGQPGADRRQPKILSHLAPGTSEVGRQHQSRAATQQFPERGDGGADPHVVGDPAAMQWHVEVGTDEDPLAGDVAEVVERAERHSFDATSSTRSTSRLE